MLVVLFTLTCKKRENEWEIGNAEQVVNLAVEN